MNLTGRPIYQKGAEAPKKAANGLSRAKAPLPQKVRLAPKSAKNRRAAQGLEALDYMRAIRALNCHCCDALSVRQEGPTEFHHAKHWLEFGRPDLARRWGGSQKAPDWAGIPLCRLHHTGAQGVHTKPDLWRALWGNDVALAAAYHKRVTGDEIPLPPVEGA